MNGGGRSGAMYRYGWDKAVPLAGEDVSGWTLWDGGAIPAAGTSLIFAQVDADGLVLAAGAAEIAQ